ncbi:hypothetical protein [Latilactobacillus fuchuensis]|uniref:DUF1819 family protein n=1 Tax=Latilactobacillus fuchuensis TaxID=164393 RepID=A0A2N9DUW5_9LACO|nr:hypothetical protein [Latilactobacillus fuchuensis]SPC38242.1 conserved hypothetical protein [Latilactobacillus fuchuensis]
MKKTIGLFRVMNYEELDKAAELMLRYSPKEAYEILDEILMQYIAGATFRRKALNNLTKVWGNGQKSLNKYQISVLQKYPEVSSEERIAMQLLMTLYSFPFFSDVVTIIGKYIRMNDNFQSKTIMEEIRNTYGMTETVSKGGLSVLGTLVNWGFLRTDKNGKYDLTGKKIKIENEFIKNMIVYASLANSDAEYISLESINNHSGLFMFDFNINSSDIIFNNIEMIRERSDVFVKLN